jgi:hypothetical protein
MARVDWRWYYVLTFADGTCSPYAYRNAETPRRGAQRAKRPNGTRPPVVGVLHVKGKTPAAQQAIYARCIDKGE